MTAVKSNGYSIKFASEDLKNDFEIIALSEQNKKKVPLSHRFNLD